MKKIWIVLLSVVVVIFVMLLAKDLIIKASVEKGVELVTGLKLDLGSLKVGILKPVVDIKDLRLLNPQGFADQIMMAMPEIYVNYDPGSIAGGKIHLPEVRLALKEFFVIKNSKGELNINAFKSMRAQKKDESPSKKTSSKAPEIQIDILKLNIGKVIYKDYSKAGEPKVREFNININESYSDVKDTKALINLIIVKALMNTTISTITNFDLKGMQGVAGGVITGAQEAASTAVSTIGEAGRQVTDTMKGLLDNTLGLGNQTE